ncbi:Lrp/AsnC family transcriptional regulator [Curvivirga aplysinae]|uniref:Lrp/AsnC family transcriptional regulator n=1 Tax=Curvivirga aplysinae TaxID=2529852 RepID=UPI0012BB4D40|nr:Lrp/AsnC family transcriptional regulator [Curvivirga aplysinae]MTI10085.1 Lrp/AsnC family transcriptional regulator [Curvivirga aplysinae]
MNENAKYIFDDLDRELLSQLRVDGRAPVSVLAGALGVSRATIQNRIDRLLASGALLGFTVRVREDHGDSTIRAVMMIEILGKSTTEVIKKLRGMPELYKLHTTNGKWDLVAEIHTDSLQSFDRVLREVRLIDGVSNSETSMLLTSV